MSKKPKIEVETIPEASVDDAFAAFDYTCRHYLLMSADAFLAKWDADEIHRSDDTYGLDRVLDMLPLVRP